MQSTTDAEKALLTADTVETDSGVELLDADDQVTADLRPDTADWSVQYDEAGPVHSDCEVTLSRKLDWTNARVRLWQAVNGRRWDVGVFVLTTPSEVIGETPRTWKVTGFDKLQLFTHEVGDTHWVGTDTTYLDAARAAIAAAGYTGLAPQFATEAEGKLLTEPMVWALDPSDPVTWLRVINDLLHAVGYGDLWVDGPGVPRAEPYVTPAVRPVEWVFDTANLRTNIVAGPISHEVDRFSEVNWWRFFRADHGYRPVDGDGQYTVDRVPAGGVRKPKTPPALTAADQAALEAQGNKIVDEDTQVIETFTFDAGPFPIGAHRDVAMLEGPGLGRVKLLVVSRTIPRTGLVRFEAEVVKLDA